MSDEVSFGDAVWVGLRLRLPPDAGGSEAPDGEALAEALHALGAEGLEWREPGTGRVDAAAPERVEVMAAFPLPAGATVEDEAALEATVIAEVGEAAQLMERSRFEPIDWATHWRRHFAPIDFGGVWVVPSWLSPPAGAESVLRIDPSSAFGTGLHPTTALCMEHLVAARPARVLDVGTGTGILAMAAVRLGGTAVGTDHDPEAVRVAAENRTLNGIPAEAFSVSTAGVAELGQTFPYVVANILAGPLVELAPELAAAVAPGGTLVLSGLLDRQVEEVRAVYLAHGLEWAGGATRSEWARLDFTRPAEGVG